MTCFLDLCQRTISYSLNGQNLGVAFSNISTGPGIFYKPAISLNDNETVVCNFGEAMLKHANKKYGVFHKCQHNYVCVLQYYANCLQRLVDLWTELNRTNLFLNREPFLMCICGDIISHINKLLYDNSEIIYRVQIVLLPMLFRLLPSFSSLQVYRCKMNKFPDKSDPSLEKFVTVLNWFVAFLNTNELWRLVKVIVMIAKTTCESPSADGNFVKMNRIKALLGILMSTNAEFCSIIKQIIFNVTDSIYLDISVNKLDSRALSKIFDKNRSTVWDDLIKNSKTLDLEKQVDGHHAINTAFLGFMEDEDLSKNYPKKLNAWLFHHLQSPSSKVSFFVS